MLEVGAFDGSRVIWFNLNAPSWFLRLCVHSTPCAFGLLLWYRIYFHGQASSWKNELTYPSALSSLQTRLLSQYASMIFSNSKLYTKTVTLFMWFGNTPWFSLLGSQHEMGTSSGWNCRWGLALFCCTSEYRQTQNLTIRFLEKASILTVLQKEEKRMEPFEDCTKLYNSIIHYYIL